MNPNATTQWFPVSPEGGAGNTCLACGLALPPLTPPELCPRCLLGEGLRGAALLPFDRTVYENKRFGPYQISKLLGRGGMGEVHEADDLETGRRVALKVISQRLDSPDARRRFLNEGRIAATINHPNSVYVFSAEEVAGIPVISMELMPGGTLEDKVRAQGALPVTEVADIALQLIEGLTAAHAAGILHRDIKPSNCFVDADGSVKLGDYGLSISTKGHERPPVDEESFMGTPAFAAPEQLRGDDLSVRSDIYSLGATLFVLLSGRPPFEAKGTVRLLAKVLESPLPDLGKLRPEVPKGFVDVVRRCLEKSPDDRFPSCAELGVAIAPFSSRGRTSAQPWQRLIAGALDMSVFGIPFLVASHMVSSAGNHMAHVQAALLLCTLFLWIAWFTLFEWKYGRTPGKALFGLEVHSNKRDDTPWIAALPILGRSSLFILLPVIATFSTFPPLHRITSDSGLFSVHIFWHLFKATWEPSQYEWQWGLGTLVAWAATTFFIFSGANRRNGWLALHDWLTDTRILARAGRKSARRKPADQGNQPVEGTPRLGPYHILETVPGCDEWQIGYDPKLLRKTWIRKLQPGTPPLVPAHRSLRRPGRLRWLAGMRTQEENWDAFEFPGGRSITSFTERVPWHQLLPWMADLATELNTAATDGTVPALNSIDRIWITADGHAKLLDFPAPGISHPTPETSRLIWLCLVDRMMENRPPPLPVGTFLRKLSDIQDPAEIAYEIENLPSVPHEVTRVRRLCIAAASTLGPALLAIFLHFYRETSLLVALFWAFTLVATCVALPAIIAATISRDGLILRTFGVCVVDKHGRPASRMIASRRSLIAWLPTLTSPALFAAFMIGFDPVTAAGLTLASLGLIAMVSALFPERSLHDRLAGTWLVSR